jgi:hypothetical protein
MEILNVRDLDQFVGGNIKLKMNPEKKCVHVCELDTRWDPLRGCCVTMERHISLITE